MLGRVQKFIFFLLVFCLSFQVGLHLWPEFSYVSGVRIDYLSPTIYLLDILIIAFIFVSLPELFKKKIKFVLPSFLKITLLFFLLNILLNIFISKSSGAHIFGIIKLLEFSLFAFIVSQYFKKKDIRYFIDTIVISAIFSSFLAILQFFSQKSVGGLWYFLGERTFNLTTVGISTVNLNEQLLRPYAAFPHPNVLAFFLLIAIVFAFYRLGFEKKKGEKYFLVVSLVLLSSALILTFSRISIFLAICFLFYEVFTKIKRNVGVFFLVSVLFAVLAIAIAAPQFLFRGVDFRKELLDQSIIIISNNFYFGIGLSNFFTHQMPLIREISPVIFQPVHNIFVLSFLSLGLFGFWIIPALFVTAFRSASLKMQTSSEEVAGFYKCVMFILLAIVVAGMFDHFFLTLEQGQIMLALTLGLAFSKLNS